MNPSLQQQLTELLTGRVAIVGLGNPERSDDGLALDLLHRLQQGCLPGAPSWELLPAATNLEQHLHRLTTGAFRTVLFVDAVQLGAAPGSVALLGSTDLQERFPQTSTHRLSLALVASMIETGGVTTVRLLGVQPGSLRPGRALTPAVQRTVTLLAGWLAHPGVPPVHLAASPRPRATP